MRVGSFSVTTFLVTYQYIVNMFRSKLEDVATHCQTTSLGLFEILSHDLLQSSPIFHFDLPAKAYLDKSRSRLLDITASESKYLVIGE